MRNAMSLFTFDDSTQQEQLCQIHSSTLVSHWHLLTTKNLSSHDNVMDNVFILRFKLMLAACWCWLEQKEERNVMQK